MNTTTDADGEPFFQPDTHYFLGDPYKAPEQTYHFQCVAVALHPRPGAGMRAFGFLRCNAPDEPWASSALDAHEFPKWTEITTPADSHPDTGHPDEDEPDTIHDYTDTPDGHAACTEPHHTADGYADCEGHPL